MRLALPILFVALTACTPATSEHASETAATATFETYVEKRDDGLQIEVFAPGDGPAIGPTSRVVLHYNALLPGATKPFDSTRESGIPLELDLGASSGPKPVPGLARGLIGLKRGAKAKLTLPPALAWGDAGNPANGVPAASDVVYSIEILEVR
ncbi:MAG: FKBP-type peptidyl-prolyl cis-trans isomerase [Planctomycetes bacterium]|nr:FKBP-type peptidyl-prolyl cis-trans isomerase [Planctomycetota bacterium]